MDASTWSSATFDTAMDAQTETFRIQQAYVKLLSSVNLPKDMAVFSHSDMYTGAVTIYFSPRASQLGKIASAKPCKKPSKDGLKPVVGQTEAWELLFPD